MKKTKPTVKPKRTVVDVLEDILTELKKRNAPAVAETSSKPKFKTIKLDDSWNARALSEVKAYLEKEYPKDGWALATEEQRDAYIAENPNPDLPDWTWVYFFGSVVRDADGLWRVPYSKWDGAAWGRDAYRLLDGWYSDYRVVLVAK